ncbi:MAG: permease [Chloroflexi bacterium]|nr:permease [Chloroflexota bacterium]
MSTYAQVLAPGYRRYYLSLTLFLVSLGLLLFTVVEMRRAFLFPLSDYIKVGSPSAILYLNPGHVPLLVLAGLGIWLGYSSMARLEGRLKGARASLKAMANLLGIAIMLFLVVDLFIYRGVPASRIAAAGKMGVGRAIDLGRFPAWLEPLGEGINYMALVWHATVLGILIGALLLAVVAGFLKPLIGRKGFKAHLAGAALAVPQPFCSCCAAPIGAALYNGGAALGPTLAFVVSSPMLNPTSLILASVLLPGEFALLRILGGLAVGVLLTYAVSLAASRWASRETVNSRPSRWVELSAKLVGGYSQLFRFGDLAKGRSMESPAELVSTWLTMAWKLGRVVVPVLFMGSVVTAAAVKAVPSPSDSLLGVLAASAFGTMLMVPTWTEIPIAAGLIREGLSGPAAALLLTLPAVSIPCLLIVGGAIRSFRVALLLGLLVFLVGFGAGVVFLYA